MIKYKAVCEIELELDDFASKQDAYDELREMLWDQRLDASDFNIYKDEQDAG